jgi:branched-chain amino acid transport system substrate-binding protein
MTGPYTDTGDNYWKGIKMAIDEINDAGGLLGKALEPIRFDTQEFAPERVMQGADYLCGQMKVDSVHAGWAGWGQDVRAYGKYTAPFFADDGSQAAVDVFNEDREQYKNIFQLTDTGINQAQSMFNVLMALPYEYPNNKAVIITADDAWGISRKKGGRWPCMSWCPTAPTSGDRCSPRSAESSPPSSMWRSCRPRK